MPALKMPPGAASPKRAACELTGDFTTELGGATLNIVYETIGR